MSSPESIKVVLIGESQVGKTCIIARFLEGKFVSKTKPSLTAQYAKKVITLPDKKTLTFDLWDTAGEEKFRAMARIFLQEAKAVILVYDPTNENTFKELKEYWYNQVKSLNAIIAVVASKCDLSEKKVKEEEGKEFADSIGAIFASVSSKENIGITALFEKVGGDVKNEK